MEKLWCFSYTALDGCQMEMPFTGDNEDTKNLILLLLSFHQGFEMARADSA